MNIGDITVREMLRYQVGDKADSIISVLEERYNENMTLIEFKNLIDNIANEYKIPVVNLSIVFPFVPVKS
jgi:hypothetical protein